MHAAHLGCGKKALGIAPKKKDGGIGGLITREQMQVGKQIGHGGVARQRKLPLIPDQTHKVRNCMGVYVFKGGVQTGSFFKRAGLNGAARFEMIYETGIESGGQFVDTGKTPPDELLTGLADESLYLRLAVLIVRTFHKDQPWFAGFGGAFKFSLRGRDTHGILETIFISKNSDIKITPVQLFDINGVYPAVTSREILKQEDAEEAPQEWITFDERLHRPAFFCKFILDTADEYFHFTLHSFGELS
jgi:hypothetical protein